MPTLANLMVGLGYDLSALEKGAPEAFRLINSQTAGMSAEMKRSAREGAEAFRSIDEMIGIHINRPMTRLLVETFPLFARALSSALGGVAFGAVAFAGYEVYDRVARKIEEAKKAQEEFAESSRKAAESTETVLAGLQHRLATASGDSSAKFGLMGAEMAKQAITEIAKASDEAAAAAEKANGFWTHVYLGAGDWAEKMARGAASLADTFLGGIHGSGALSGGTGIHDKLFDPQQIANMKDALKDMRVDLEIALNTDAAKGTHQSLQLIANDIKAATGYLKDMEKAGDESGKALARASLEFFSNAQRAATLSQQVAGADAAAAAVQKFKELKKSWDENPFWQDWSHTNDELQKAIQKLREVGTLQEQAARYQKAKSLYFPDVEKATPVLGTGGGTAAEQLQAFAKDTDAQQALLKEAFQSAITPMQQYELKVQELRQAFDGLPPELKNSAQAQAAFNAELAKLGSRATDAELHLQELSKKLDEMLSHSTSASAGVQAFFLQLQIDSAQNGKIAFDLLNTGLKGFEDNLTKMVFDGKAKWRDFFRSLTEEAFKFLLNKEISGFFQTVGSSSIGKNLGLGGLIPGVSGTAGLGGTTLAAASTTLQSGSTLLVTAATTLQAAATSLSAGSAAGVAGAGGGGAGIFGEVAGFASGTDDAPGGMAWVGEQGPELLNLPAGSSVTPASSLRSGGGDQHFYIDAKGAEIGVEEKIVRALQAAKPRFIGEALANFSEVQKRTPQSR